MRSILFLTTIFLALIMFAACGGGAPAATAVPTVNVGAIQTQAAANIFATQTASVPTVDVAAVQTQAALSIFSTQTASVPTATATPRATNTPLPSPTSAAGFGPVTIAAAVLDDYSPADPASTFPDGTQRVYASFTFTGLKNGQAWRREWLFNGKVDVSRDDTWSLGASGIDFISLYQDGGLDAGDYQVNLYLDGKLQQSAKFIVQANPSGQPDFSAITFAADKDANDKPVKPLAASETTFASGTKIVYAFYKAINVPKGTAFTREWLLNGQPLQDGKKALTWDDDPNAEFWSSWNVTPGTYEFKLSIGDRLVSLGTFIIPK